MKKVKIRNVSNLKIGQWYFFSDHPDPSKAINSWLVAVIESEEIYFTIKLCPLFTFVRVGLTTQPPQKKGEMRTERILKTSLLFHSYTIFKLNEEDLLKIRHDLMAEAL